MFCVQRSRLRALCFLFYELTVYVLIPNERHVVFFSDITFFTGLCDFDVAWLLKTESGKGTCRGNLKKELEEGT